MPQAHRPNQRNPAPISTRCVRCIQVAQTMSEDKARSVCSVHLLLLAFLLPGTKLARYLHSTQLFQLHLCFELAGKEAISVGNRDRML